MRFSPATIVSGNTGNRADVAFVITAIAAELRSHTGINLKSRANFIQSSLAYRSGLDIAFSETWSVE
jgi:hypothetical protein